jgi:Zn-finger nucleic acid-binding protein
MNCPRCNIDLQPQKDRGVDVEVCPNCQGMWLTPAELDALENVVFDNEEAKGSLYLVTQETELKCPVCSAALKQFDYRFFDLQLDCCPDHGFWLDKDKDKQILEIMSGEEKRLEREFSAEDRWAHYIGGLKSPSFFSKIKSLI